MHNAVILLSALVLDYILGDPVRLPHPVRGIGRLVNIYEKAVRKLKSIPLKAGGFALLVLTVLTTVFIVSAALLLAYRMHPLLYTAVLIYFLYTSLAAKCLHNEAVKIYKALESGEIDKARKALSMLVGRDTKGLDGEQVVAAVVETVAENTIDGVIAPLFYMGLGFMLGIPVQCALFYKAVNTLDSMVGYIQQPYREIGFASAKMDDIMNFLPARLGSILMIGAGKLLGYDGMNGLRIFKRDRYKHKSPNSGHPEAAAAGLLQIRLGGPGTYFGELVDKPYIGDAGCLINKRHIKDAIKIMYGAQIIMALIIAILVLLVK